MRIIRILTIVLCVTEVAACALFNRGRGQGENTRKPPSGGIVEFQVMSYDGRDLGGRVLVGATTEPVVLGQRLLAWTRVGLKNIRLCDTQEGLETVVADEFLLLERGESEELVTILPGYWYGRNMRFWLFDKEHAQSGPECFEADLVIWDPSGRVVATAPLRVRRTESASSPMDGGDGGTQ